ncbi:MAG: hypothetical protein WCG66_06050 [bacterium]
MPDAPTLKNKPGAASSGLFLARVHAQARGAQALENLNALTRARRWMIESPKGGIAITASQKIARDAGASSRAIQAAQPGASAWDAERQAICDEKSMPWYILERSRHLLR